MATAVIKERPIELKYFTTEETDQLLSHAIPGNSWLGIKNVTECRKELLRGGEGLDEKCFEEEMLEMAGRKG
jgi:hypothetical protein